MTQSEIQAIIDRGGFILCQETKTPLLAKPKRICTPAHIGYECVRAISFLGLKTEECYIDIVSYRWREATPEEVEKYVPKKYRNNIVVHETTGVASGGNTTQVITVNSSNGIKSNTNDIFAQKAMAKANSVQANNSMDKASHIKKIKEYLIFQQHPQTATNISIGTGISYHAVNRRVGEMVSANMIERCGTLKKQVNGKLLSYSLYKSI